MDISRRDFLKYCLSSAAALGLSSSVIFTLKKVLANEVTVPNVIWIEGAGCSGCSTSLLNFVSNEYDGGPMNAHDLLTNSISVAYSQILMSAPGDLAVSNLRAAQGGEFILVVEGAIPTAFNGMTCTVFTENGVDVSMKQIVSELAPRAKVVICVGTCSSFGGIPAAAPNPTGITTVKALTGVSTINIPGCPAHPDWIAGTLATLLCGGTLATDSDGRPSALFSETVHDHCPKKALYTMLARARNFGVEGFCLYHLGCKGRETKADCPVRGWNNGFNYCVSSNGSCIGCVESTFPINPMIKR